MTISGWGDATTRTFFELTPDRVLDAVESAGVKCTGRCLAANSFENRVYDVEIETDEAPKTPAENRRIVKFYRPGRWTKDQILEEHAFLADLGAAEIPAVAPLPFADGSTLRTLDSGIHYCLFPKIGGRAPDELDDESMRRVGRLLARIHQVGAAREAKHRIRLTPETYGIANLEFLLEKGLIPGEFRERYETAARAICAHTSPWFAEARVQRVHGDCHLGNLLQRGGGGARASDAWFFVDFDDLCVAPPAQDLWLLLPGRDRQKLEVLLEGYEEIGDFDRTTLRLIEPLRALRFIHYTGWVARRWDDPAFPQAFPQFGTYRYWKDETEDLERQWHRIRLGQLLFEDESS
ncbi:MAG: serine/threonine protein kinase [Bdellovibrionales bacterium]|nr:serine/threonine protein kinase [Bdellovibrionales bacterium]